MRRRWILMVVMMATPFLSVGCESDACSRMQKCCAEVKDVEGMGSACGKLAKNVTKPETCLSVVQTVSYMYDDRGEELPAACQISE